MEHPGYNPHFTAASSWQDAATLVSFEPIVPGNTEGWAVQSFAVHVLDHKRRELAVGERSLEVDYGAFSFSQARKGKVEARRWAIEKSYGADPRELRVAGHEARSYEMGPVPDPDDVDPRMPAVVTWHENEMFYLLASNRLDVDVLFRIAESCYFK